MGLRDRVRRRVRRTIERTAAAEVPADQPVRINDLISPLRYDALVRQHYLAVLVRSPDLLEGDLGPLLELSRSHEYYMWFVSVVVPPYMPRWVGREDLINAAFERRVRATVDLVRSVQESGFDPARPITLQTGRWIRPTATGKRLARRIYLQEGCHRLALLRASGVDLLEPGSYRLDRQQLFAPRDATQPLLRAGLIDTKTYWEFMALSYDSLVAADRSGPAPEGQATDPKRFAEMLEVAAIDAPSLRASQPTV